MSDSTHEQSAKTIFDNDAIAQQLAERLPKWHYEDGFICRTYRTAGWKGTLMVINAVGHLCEAAWHHPDIVASYPSVVVKLMTHDIGGITEKDFALAEKIEEVVQWRPGIEGGALQGTPDDPRFAYVKYD